MNKQVKEVLNKIETIKRLVSEGFVFNEIKDILNISSRQLTCFCYRHSLDKIPKNKPIRLTEDEEQIVIGSLLGDGCISQSNSDNAKLTFHHCAAQKEYFMYKVNYMKRFINATPNEKFRQDKREGWKGYYSISVSTFNNPTFTTYRANWYKGLNNKKEIHESDILKLKPLGLAIWFMDDGYYSSGDLALCTQSFKKDEIGFLSNFLKERYNIETIVRKDNTLYIRRKSHTIFINLIKPYIIESMMYKIKSRNSVNSGDTHNTDNPDPSVVNDKEVTTKEQRLIGEESTNNPNTSAEIPKSELFHPYYRIINGRIKATDSNWNKI